MMNLGLMDPAFLGGLGGLSLYDPDAAAYISAVEAADGQALEAAVKTAIDNFVRGCKTDGIWNAIKASCILAGARTLAGALVPLVGTAPTRFGTEGGWSYNRKTGLQGNGTDNYLNSNRANNADPLNNAHLSSFASTHSSVSNGYIGLFNSPTTTVSLVGMGATSVSRFYLQSTSQIILGVPQNSTLLGISRSTAGQTNTIVNGQTATQANTSTSTLPLNYFIFAYNNNGSPGFYTNARLAFYSIGESLDLALLNARVTALVNALAVAIP